MMRPVKEGPAPVAAGSEPQTDKISILDLDLAPPAGKAGNTLPYLPTAHERRLLAARVLIERIRGGRS